MMLETSDIVKLVAVDDLSERKISRDYGQI
jgi:hypothetical protein